MSPTPDVDLHAPAPFPPATGARPAAAAATPAAAAATPAAVVFRGSKSLCREFSLVLEAQAIEHEIRESGDAWALTVAPPILRLADEEISRYAAESSAAHTAARSLPKLVEPFGGAAAGALGYVIILLLVAYCAGIGLFGADWVSMGALDAGAPREWWRAVTALTLHLDQEHLLGNLLFGVFAGIAAGRLLGPGIAWASILGAGALANFTEVLIAPASHRALGASTAVFATLGLLAGLAWRERLTLRERLTVRERLTLRERRWYRWAPLIAGICLLTLLGAGTEHVDVLGHGLGFLFGVGAGWLYAKTRIPRGRGNGPQVIAGCAAMLLVGAAWFAALWRGV